MTFTVQKTGSWWVLQINGEPWERSFRSLPEVALAVYEKLRVR